MSQQVLDAHFQRQRGRGAPRTGTLHMQIDNTSIKSVERDVTTVLSHGRAYARIKQFLDLSNDLAVFTVMLRMTRAGFMRRSHNGLT